MTEGSMLSFVLSRAGNPALLSVIGTRIMIDLKEAGETGLNQPYASYLRRSITPIYFTEGNDRSPKPSPLPPSYEEALKTQSVVTVPTKIMTFASAWSIPRDPIIATGLSSSTSETSSLRQSDTNYSQQMDANYFQQSPTSYFQRSNTSLFEP